MIKNSSDIKLMSDSMFYGKLNLSFGKNSRKM